MHFKFVLGVDMSKDWFNFCLMDPQFKILWEGQVDNRPDDIFAFLSQLLKLDYIEKLTDVLLCMEHTGIYVQHLRNCWLSKGGEQSLVHATKVSEHLAGQLKWEDKDDQLDARRLAEYALRYEDKLKLWEARDETMVKLQNFQRQRERLNKAINLLEVPVNESLSFDSMDISQSLMDNQAAGVKTLKEDLNRLEKIIHELVDADPYLAQLFQLIASVEGIGPVTAREIIIATAAFTKFLPEQAKAFARYLGIVPVKKRSGKSVRKKDRITKRTHKKLKPLLTMGAQSLINSKQELGHYYQRKMAEGKQHLSVINAMRNKMILRVFAVVRNQVMYQKNINIYVN